MESQKPICMHIIVLKEYQNNQLQFDQTIEKHLVHRMRLCLIAIIIKQFWCFDFRDLIYSREQIDLLLQMVYKLN